jgi:hypothetical protein
MVVSKYLYVIVLVETTDTRRLKYSFTVMIIDFYGKYWIISIVLSWLPLYQPIRSNKITFLAFNQRHVATHMYFCN